MCLVPNVGDLTTFNELCRFLRTPRGNPHATAILTNDDRDLSAVMLPDSVRMARLTDVIGLDNEGRLSINRDALARRVCPRGYYALGADGYPRSARRHMKLLRVSIGNTNLMA